jgi:hypothetical protein
MMSANIHIDDVGTIFERTIKDQDGTIVDISAATTSEFIFRKPDGISVIKDAVFVTDGTDGKMHYVTIPDDLDLEGFWQWQGHIILASGEWYTDILQFKVCENLPIPAV